METLIIYDNTGYILFDRSGEPAPREPIGVPFMWTEIPKGKRIKITDGIGVDTSVVPHKVILEDIPPTQLDSLESRLEATQQALDFLILQNLGGK